MGKNQAIAAASGAMKKATNARMASGLLGNWFAGLHPRNAGSFTCES